MIRKNWTEIPYDEMTKEEIEARDTLLKLGDILVKFRNGVISSMEAKLEVLELQEEDNWESFEAAMNELNKKDFLQIINLLEVEG